MTLREVRADNINPTTDQWAHQYDRKTFLFPVNFVQVTRDGGILVDYGDPKVPELHAWYVAPEYKVLVDRRDFDNDTEVTP